MIEKGKENYFKKFFSWGLSSKNGVRYSRCKAKNVTFYYKNVAYFGKAWTKLFPSAWR